MTLLRGEKIYRLTCGHAGLWVCVMSVDRNVCVCETNQCSVTLRSCVPAGETLKSALMEFPVRSFSHHNVAVIVLTP